MSTIFDLVTVGCLGAVVLAYFYFGINNLRALLHLLVAGAAFAVANQLGNAGFVALAILLTIAGAGYAALIIRHNLQH